MIVDHRTYTAHPGKLADFLKVYSELGFELQKKYLGECIGWYISMDIGELNQAVHLWRYKDLADRAARREKLNADPEWQKYLAAATPFLQKMENKIVTTAPFFK
ncbi:MAG: NIPSNAP family protein [Granulosicoccus sp.]|nr:NIPSNAP family protein [Granulosicoccus sp.]